MSIYISTRNPNFQSVVSSPAHQTGPQQGMHIGNKDTTNHYISNFINYLKHQAVCRKRHTWNSFPISPIFMTKSPWCALCNTFTNMVHITGWCPFACIRSHAWVFRATVYSRFHTSCASIVLGMHGHPCLNLHVWLCDINDGIDLHENKNLVSERQGSCCI